MPRLSSQPPASDADDWLPASTFERVAVTCSARRHGGQPRRLPDRYDARGALAAVLVDDPDHATQVFRLLDVPGRTIYVDVERKQEVDLYGVAASVVRRASLAHTKPNDVTVRSLDVLVTRLFGSDLRQVRVGVYGTGNLGFKTALLLAERNATVYVAGRSNTAVDRTIEAINAILPAHQSRPVQRWEADRDVTCLISAVTAQGVIGREWVDSLAEGAHVVDVGIDNLHSDFIAGALASGATVTRLDTRAAESQTVVAAPGFFEEIYGSTTVAGVPVVSGGVVGERGVVVVDRLMQPTRVIGVANGIGGLVPDASQTVAEKERIADVQRSISHG